MRRTLLLAVLLGTSAAVPVSAESPHRPVVVELFTSQGCSSCPPADAFLTDLARERMDVLPLGFHVTYWNSLGWHDPYSLDAATQRQRRYAGQLGTDTVYTPQMVVDGRRDVVGSDRAAALVAIREAAARTDAAPVLRVTRMGGRVVIDAGAGRGSGTLLLVGYDPEHRTAVGRGENAGRSLTESNLVREMVQAGEWTGSPAHLEAAAPAGERTAVLLQAPDGAIIAAARAEGGPAT